MKTLRSGIDYGIFFQIGNVRIGRSGLRRSGFRLQNYRLTVRLEKKIRRSIRSPRTSAPAMLQIEQPLADLEQFDAMRTQKKRGVPDLRDTPHHSSVGYD